MELIYLKLQVECSKQGQVMLLYEVLNKGCIEGHTRLRGTNFQISLIKWNFSFTFIPA